MGRDGILTACPVPSLYIPGQPLERPRNKRKKNTEFVPGLLHLHWDNGTAGQAKLFVPGQRDSGTGKTFLSWDKGATGQGNFFVPGQRDKGKSRHSLSRDVPSLGNPSRHTEVE